ncbi:MAG: PilZ domain-containing protein [Desulfobacteraceae bacterium]
MDDQERDDSLEIEELTDNSRLTDVVRSSFRIPVDGKKKFYLLMENRQFFLSDISLNGLGFFAASTDLFSLGDILYRCEVRLDERHIKDLQGRIAHLTPYGEGELICGIQWIDLPRDTEKILTSFFLEFKKNLLG